MGKADYLILGDWNTQCYQCGQKAKASQLVRNWKGYYVHPEHNEPRQTQDFVRAVPDPQIPPWVQPWPGVVYTYTNTTIGVGDGITTQYQGGDGLYALVITSVQVAGSPATYSATTNGLITLSVAPTLGQVVTFSGTETVV